MLSSVRHLPINLLVLLVKVLQGHRNGGDFTRAIILVAMLACSALMVPLTLLVTQQFLHAPSIPRFARDFNSGFNGIRGTPVKPQLKEPGSGGGGGGVI